MSGGEGSPAPEPDICVRIGKLIDAGQLPVQPPTRIWAGASRGGRQCAACGGILTLGEIEYEVTVAATVVFMHIRCVELWAVEAERRADVARVIRAKIEMGDLPRARPAAVAVRTGAGDDCTACGRPISRLDILYEFVMTGREFRLHRKCLEAWHDQRGQLGLA